MTVWQWIKSWFVRKPKNKLPESFVTKGTRMCTDDLPKHANHGDAYIINGDLWIYVTARWHRGQWRFVGRYKNTPTGSATPDYSMVGRSDAPVMDLGGLLVMDSILATRANDPIHTREHTPTPVDKTPREGSYEGTLRDIESYTPATTSTNISHKGDSSGLSYNDDSNRSSRLSDHSDYVRSSSSNTTSWDGDSSSSNSSSWGDSSGSSFD